MVLYPRYFRQHGCRLIQHLQAPVINTVDSLDLPKESVMHYLPENSILKGIPSDHWAVKQAERLAMVYHVEALAETATEGNPKRLPVMTNLIIRDYHRQNRKLKPVIDLERNIRDPKTPLVINYALLDELYRYTQSLYSHYYKQRNILDTFWTTLNEFTTKVPGRQHFFEIELPTPIPSLASFRFAESKLTLKLLEEFSTPEHLLILDLWHWLGINQATSSVAKVLPEAWPLCNVIIKHEQHWVWLNLGVLATWRMSIEGNETGISPDALQKRFLRVLISLFESSTPTELAPETTTTKPVETTPLSELEVNKPQAETKAEIQTVLQDTPTDTLLEEELDSLRNASLQKADAEFKDPFIDTEETLESGILQRAEKLAEAGFLSAAEYKRYEKIAVAYKDLKDPYTGRGSLVEATIVTPEDVAIKEPTLLQDNVAIIDKSMLQSSLQHFDSRYVNNVFKKDVLGCVLNLQKAGIAITDYQVESIEDVANAYEIHTVKLTPVAGKSTTIRFKLPTIQPDGTFTANTIKYRARRQRVD
jgi:hypothetical protein